MTWGLSGPYLGLGATRGQGGAGSTKSRDWPEIQAVLSCAAEGSQGPQALRQRQGDRAQGSH